RDRHRAVLRAARVPLRQRRDSRLPCAPRARVGLRAHRLPRPARRTLKRSAPSASVFAAPICAPGPKPGNVRSTCAGPDPWEKGWRKFRARKGARRRAGRRARGPGRSEALGQVHEPVAPEGIPRCRDRVAIAEDADVAEQAADGRIPVEDVTHARRYDRFLTEPVRVIGAGQVDVVPPTRGVAILLELVHLADVAPGRRHRQVVQRRGPHRVQHVLPLGPRPLAGAAPEPGTFLDGTARYRLLLELLEPGAAEAEVERARAT